jgi:hypothetical protein
MTDKVIFFRGDPLPRRTPVKVTDNGDGTYSLNEVLHQLWLMIDSIGAALSWMAHVLTCLHYEPRD